MISSQDENGYITLEFQKLHVIGLKTLSQLKSDKVIIALVSTVHVLVALSSTLEANSTDSLSTQHCAKFESNTNRMTFETNTILLNDIRYSGPYKYCIVFFLGLE